MTAKDAILGAALALSYSFDWSKTRRAVWSLALIGVWCVLRVLECL